MSEISHLAHGGAETLDALAELLPETVLRDIGRYGAERRLLLLPGDASPEWIAEGLAALANATGGVLLLGVEQPADGAAARLHPAIPDEETMRAALALVDPPLDDLVRLYAAPATTGSVLVAVVAMSVDPPHVVQGSGRVLLATADGVRPVDTRRGLDALYARGRARRERSTRLLDALIDRLLQSHYAFYSIGVVACTRLPSAEPFLQVRDDPALLARIAPEFCAEWSLDPEKVKVRPGEIELRGEREVSGFIRVLRAGAAVCGEVRRRPPSEELASIDTLRDRITRMTEIVCAALAPAGESIVPCLYFEGVRGRRLTLSDGVESAQIAADTGQVQGPNGDPSSPAYRAELAAGLFAGALRAFGLADLPAGD